MKESESGEMDFCVAPRVRPRKTFLAGKGFTGGVMALGLVVLVFGIGLLASHCEHSFYPAAELLRAEHMVSEAAHELVIRGEGSERGVMFRSLADAMAAKVAGSSGLGTVTVTATATATATAFKSVGTLGGTAPAATMQPGTAQTPWMPSGLSAAKTALEDHTGSSDAAPIGVSVPISTHTELSTIYSIRSTVNTTVHLTMTRTATTTVTLPVSSEVFSSEVVSSEVVSSTADTCICSACTAAKTVSIYVTVFPMPPHKTVTGDASTVTLVNTDLSLTNRLPDVTLPGKPSTRTAVQTDVSLTRGLPDATVSGNPETLTDVETDVSVTTGLPDATVSGNPETLTNVETDVSVTTGLPDATVSGKPETVTNVKTSASVISKTPTAVTTVVITDLWGPAHSSRRTLTATVTIKETVATTEGPEVVTITISDLYGPPAKPSGWSSALAEAATGPASETGALTTETVTMTQTGGPPATSITTVHVTPAKNTTAPDYPYPSGSAVATAPFEVSGGSKKPQPRGWVGGGSTNLGCTVMLLTVIMFAI
ncbi:hypothetical protein OCS_04865 [Ophiocordyceps sinensis CO18]|nr:hypothetical protein OCS_04865 [Ophiocordyceps sinensis CO18]